MLQCNRHEFNRQTACGLFMVVSEVKSIMYIALYLSHSLAKSHFSILMHITETVMVFFKNFKFFSKTKAHGYKHNHFRFREASVRCPVPGNAMAFHFIGNINTLDS